MSPSIRIVRLLIVMLLAARLEAEDAIAGAEAFLMAEDRERVVAALPPGSADQRYYRCLLWQQEGKLKEVDEALAAWKAWDKDTLDLERFTRIRARQALLWYASDHQHALDLLRRELDLDVELPAQRNAAPDATPPSTLDPALLSWETVRSRGLAAGELATSFSAEGLERLGAELADTNQVRELLKCIAEPRFPRAVELVVAELRDPASLGFGALPLHHRLSRAQLEACRTALPALGGDADFIRTFAAAVRKAHVGASWEGDPATLRAYLEDLLGFATSLSPANPALEAVVRFNLLALARDAGTVARADLLAYLRLPGTAEAIAGRRARAQAAAGKENWQELLGLRGSRDDREVVADGLALVLAKEADEVAFAGEFTAEPLHALFIDAKLAAGIGDAERWLKLPGHVHAAAPWRQAELRFVPGAKQAFRGGDDAFVAVELRNIEEAQLRVYTLNAAAIYAQTNAEIPPFIDLDGVVPNHERQLSFSAAPLVRHRERIVLPECASPGTYVVEIVAAGQSLRALLRKGQLRMISRDARDGQRLRIYDEDNKRVLAASAWLNGQEFTADARGEIRLPYAAQPRHQNLILVQGGRASLAGHQLESERYDLQADLLIDREQLIAGATATALLHLRLLVNQAPLPLATLREAKLKLSTITAGNDAATTEIPLAQLRDDAETVVRFPVPAHTANIVWEVNGLVDNRSAAEEQPLRARGAIDCNGIERTAATASTFLEATAAGYELAHLGRAGEARAGAVVRLSLHHRLLLQPITVTLATDAGGRIHLGSLPEIDALQIAEAADSKGEQNIHRWTLHDRQFLEDKAPIHAAVGAIVQLPWAEEALADTWCERIRATRPPAGAEPQLALRDGQLAISGLSAGTYWLHGRRHELELVIADGIADGDLLVGAEQVIELGGNGQLGVSAQVEQDGSATIAVTNAGPHPRIHVLGRRFQPANIDDFRGNRRWLEAWNLPLLPSVYTSVRDLGDEYRYIAARAKAKRLPGIMLERPGLLLNTWRDDKMSRLGADGDGSGMYGSREGGGKRRALAKGGGIACDAAMGAFDNVDFLAAPGIVLANLLPDGQGRVHIPAAQLGDARLLAVVACDDYGSARAVLPLPARPLRLRELALAKALDPATHPAFKYRALVVPAGGTLAAPSGTITQRAYHHLGEIYRLFATLAPTAQLEDFSFLPRWSTLSEHERLALYDRFSSHELNLFLYFKDRPFFDRVVAPYLVNKLQKTFLDHWLLGDDLAPWLESARHDDLNSCERILLAQRLPAPAAAEEIRSLAGEAEPTVDERAQWNELAGSALAAQAQAGAQSGPDLDIPEPKAAPPSKVAPLDHPKPSPPAANKPVPDRDIDIANAPTALEFYRRSSDLVGLSERNYFGVSDTDARASLVGMNRFWYEFAHHGTGALLTPACLVAHGSRSEILLALSILDLPFEPAGAPTAPAADEPAAITPVLVVRSAIESLPVRLGDLRLEQRLYRKPTGKMDLTAANLVGTELVPGTAYCSVLTVINPSPHDRQVELLAQIPQGAVGIAGSSALLGRSLLVKACANAHLELDFYFPAAGTFAQFPAHLAEGDAVVAVADAPAELRVHQEAAPVGTWDQRGSAEVLAQLANADLATLDLTPLLPRLEDRGFFAKVIAVLQQRRVYDRRVWSYALRHDLPAAITTLLLHETDLIERLGRALDAPLLHLDPIPDRLVRHLDLSALSNPRSHRFAGVARGGDGPLDQRYGETLGWLCLRADPGSYGWLELAYQLMLQDRIVEAQAAFARIDAARLPTRLQYDYFHAWLAMHQADAATARKIAATYIDYPLASWRLRFAEVIAQLDESAGQPAKREDALARQQHQQLQAAATPSLHAELGDGQITVAASQVPACEVRYYPLDLELMFSRAPFALAGLGRVAQVSPALVEKVALDPARRLQQLPLAAGFRQRTALIEIAGAGQSQTLVSYAHALDLRLAPASGQLLVAHAGDGKPIPAAYVKVYVETSDGRVLFHKDGYTDLRGRFDYITVTGADLGAIKRLAILVDADAFGSTVREVLPPTP